MRGYPGLKNTAKEIMKYVPICDLYVEPFAGLGRTLDHYSAPKIVLNDMSKYAINYLKNKYPTNNKNVLITQMDFIKCVKTYDSKNTFFLFDPPWSKSMYSKKLNNDKNGIEIKPFCDKTPSQYYKEIFNILESIKGNWLVCMNHKRSRPSKYFERIIESKVKIMGYTIKTKIIMKSPVIIQDI